MAIRFERAVGIHSRASAEGGLGLRLPTSRRIRTATEGLAEGQGKAGTKMNGRSRCACCCPGLISGSDRGEDPLMSPPQATGLRLADRDKVQGATHSKGRANREALRPPRDSHTYQACCRPCRRTLVAAAAEAAAAAVVLAIHSVKFKGSGMTALVAVVVAAAAAEVRKRFRCKSFRPSRRKCCMDRRGTRALGTEASSNSFPDWVALRTCASAASSRSSRVPTGGDAF